MSRILILSGLMIAVLCSSAQTQERFRLFVPDTDIRSRAVLSSQTLQITDPRGRATVYERNRRFDTADGRYLGFYSNAAQQIVRWPIAGRGRMQIGSLTRGGISFRTSQMEIESLGEAATTAVRTTNRIETGSFMRLTTQDCEAVGLCLDVDRNGRLAMGRAGNFESQRWSLSPVGRGLYRIQSERIGKAWSLSCDDRTKDARLVISDSDVHQFWRVSPVAELPGYYRITNAARAHVGWSLEATRVGPPTLARTSFRAAQYWKLTKLNSVNPEFGGRRFISRDLRQNAVLTQARVELANSHTKELWVLVTDLRNPANVLRLKIPPNRSQTILLDRDSGATFTEVYDVILPNGLARRQQYVTEVPPEVYYDLSVYELVLQSIAIDRTVKGGKVEDVNYSPKSLGWFVVPPGDGIQGGRMDIYRAAKALDNPGQVRRIELKKWRPGLERKDPLEAILDEFKAKAAREKAPPKRKGREF